MRKLILLLLLFIPILSFCQSINNLENKNGYKIFKLNSDKSNYLTNLKFIERNKGYSTYNYVETAEYEIVNEYRTVRTKQLIIRGVLCSFLSKTIKCFIK